MLPKIPIQPLPQLLGIPESTLRLLIVLLSAYPAAYLYRVWALPRWSNQPNALNAYHAFVGLLFSYFFCDTDIVHSLATVFATYFISVALAPRSPNLANGLIFTVNMGYLLWGYYYKQTIDYDLGWTCPQCVLCLKLIGYGADVCDGQAARLRAKKAANEKVIDKKQQEDSNAAITADVTLPLKIFDDATSVVTEVPSFLRLLGFSYHPTTFLVGPQLTFAYYDGALKRGVRGAQDPVEEAAIRSAKNGAKRPFLNGRDLRALRCFSLSLLYMIGTQLAGALLPIKVMITPEAENWSMLYRITYMAISLKGVLMRYLGVWLMSEGACVLSGLGYNGISATGASLWDGLANVYPGHFELATQLTTIVVSFNVNTNRWVKRYIFKRLRFLGNKHISSFAALFFLAIWHGLHPGYFLTFGMEFLDMEAERRVAILWRRATGGKPLNSGLFSIFLSIIGWLWVCLQLTYGLVTMELLILERGMLLWSRVGFFGFWLSMGMIIFTIVINIAFRPSRRPATITTVVSEKAPATQQLATDTNVKERRASVLEEIDELTTTADKVAAKFNEILKEEPSMPIE
ncbi:MBOAT, membrane-bound O-acyltransferase family-domain-containing protein [Syncephalis fuscata]|nr:MBOAT, membrane-bound O-acyltransferase family-domain-containing protein [Syncephalis fuscata]